MAAALQCEICGGKLVGKPGGIFECDSCGMEYSTEWAKQKIQEIRGTVKVEGTVEVTGKVQVEGGTVNVEGAATKESLLKRAKMCYADGDWEKAAELLEQVLNADPECGEAYLYRAAVNMKCKTLEELRKQYEDIYHDDVLRHPDVEKAFQFATGALKQMLLGWKQHRDSAAAADLARREENRLTFPALRCRTDKLSKMIIAGTYHTVGLKAEGTVVAVGWNAYGQCDVSGWRDIVAISAGDGHTVGLKADGTVVAVGDNEAGRCDVSGWRDIVAISAGDFHTVGLKADGTAVAVGNNYADRCNVSGWRLFQSVDTLEEEREEAKKRREQEKARRIAQLQQQRADVQSELANLKGLFTGMRRRELESRLAEINNELKGLN